MQDLLEGECADVRGSSNNVVRLQAAAAARVACEYDVWWAWRYELQTEGQPVGGVVKQWRRNSSNASRQMYKYPVAA